MTTLINTPAPVSVHTDEAVRARFNLDGRTPDAVAMPTSEAECVELVRWAAREGCALVPWGGGHAVQQGNTLAASRWVAVSTQNLADLHEFSADDMVVTAGAGFTLESLQATLKERNQFLPIDPPDAASATLGGIVATNSYGLWRPLYGTPRDRLIGVRVVMPDGSVVKGGGKVVKNVAGYDLCKLFAGSWGTLGLITEVTFKTNPVPEHREHLVFTSPDAAAALNAALAVHTARLQPAYLTVVTPEPRLCVGLMGNAKAVAWQRSEIASLLQAAGLQERDASPTEEELRSFTFKSTSPLVASLTVRTTDLLNLMTAPEGLPLRMAAHVPTGVIELTCGAEGATTEQLRTWFNRVVRACPPGGHAVWPRVPSDWKSQVDVWGPTRGDFSLMRSIKQTMDPNGLFSPGRFIGRL
jgi:glycolate oxidase FAD binding subunit